LIRKYLVLRGSTPSLRLVTLLWRREATQFTGPQQQFYLCFHCKGSVSCRVFAHTLCNYKSKWLSTVLVSSWRECESMLPWAHFTHHISHLENQLSVKGGNSSRPHDWNCIRESVPWSSGGPQTTPSIQSRSAFQDREGCTKKRAQRLYTWLVSCLLIGDFRVITRLLKLYGREWAVERWQWLLNVEKGYFKVGPPTWNLP
jgi:hypothetical protein